METIRFPPVGQCIYCGSNRYSADRERLGDEHIIPEALGGKAILPISFFVGAPPDLLAVDPDEVTGFEDDTGGHHVHAFELETSDFGRLGVYIRLFSNLDSPRYVVVGMRPPKSENILPGRQFARKFPKLGN